MPTRREFITQTSLAAAAATAAASPIARAVAAETKKNSIDTNTANTPSTPTAPGTPTTPLASHRTLKTWRIPHTDLSVTRIAYGCAMLGLDWNSPDFIARTIPAIEAAYEHGIRFFDTADVYGYGKAEMALGRVMKQRPGMRQSIVVQSKCGDRFAQGGQVDNSRAHILASVDGSLQRLGTDHLDILLLHWPDSLVEPDEVAYAFDELKASGKVRWFGVSNHSPEQIEILKRSVREPLVINQIQLGLGSWTVPTPPGKAALTHTTLGASVVDYCRAHDMQVQAYAPLRVGYAENAPNLLRPAADASPEVKKAAATLAQVAKAHTTTPDAIMLAWLLRHPAHIVPIIGATKPEHVAQNCAADRIELTREEWYTLLDAAAAIPQAAG